MHTNMTANQTVSGSEMVSRRVSDTMTLSTGTNSPAPPPSLRLWWWGWWGWWSCSSVESIKNPGAWVIQLCPSLVAAKQLKQKHPFLQMPQSLVVGGAAEIICFNPDSWWHLESWIKRLNKSRLFHSGIDWTIYIRWRKHSSVEKMIAH